MARNNTGNPVPSASPLDRADNTLIFDELVTAQDKDEVPSRLGDPLKTWNKIQKGIEEQLIAGGQIFQDEPTGRAAVKNDQYFFSQSADPNVSKTLWKRLSSSESEFIANDPSALPFELLKPSENDAQGYAWVLVDENGRAAIGVKDDGTFEAFSLAIGSSQTETLSPELAQKYAWAIIDSDGRVAIGVTRDGSFEAANLSGRSAISSVPGLYTHQLNFIINAGQSLGEGSDGAITTTQEYDNVGFPARSLNPVSYLPLTVANTQVGTRGESPMYGALGHIKQLILQEAGLAYPQNDYQLLTANNCYGGTPIADLSKGGATGAYEQSISQVESGTLIASSEGRSFTLQAVTWTQGERDIVDGTLRDDYLASLLALQSDYNEDAKLVTGQFNDVVLITYQTCREGGQETVASAQLEASEISPHIFLACPTYQLSFYDFQHIDAASSKVLGGYYGLVYKRVIIDQHAWAPLKPISSACFGSAIDLFFNKSGLVLDVTNMPLQPNYGFSVVDELGGALTISAVRIISPNRVRLEVVSPAQPGWRVRYGWNNAQDRSDAFTGGCGNLRDSQGDSLTYEGFPLHNWCVLFEYEV